MRILKIFPVLALALCLMGSPQSEASYVQQMNLGEITTNADKIFRGSVVKIESSTIKAGGGELPTVTYTLRVSDLLKGEIPNTSLKASNIVKVTMLGYLKPPPVNKDGMQYAGYFKTPKLNVGQEYLLFTTAPSSLGLSMTVGFNQGLFRFYGNSVVNDAKNAGLFRNMDSQGMSVRGPVPYSDLAQYIRALAN